MTGGNKRKASNKAEKPAGKKVKGVGREPIKSSLPIPKTVNISKKPLSSSSKSSSSKNHDDEKSSINTPVISESTSKSSITHDDEKSQSTTSKPAQATMNFDKVLKLPKIFEVTNKVDLNRQTWKQDDEAHQKKLRKEEALKLAKDRKNQTIVSALTSLSEPLNMLLPTMTAIQEMLKEIRDVLRKNTDVLQVINDGRDIKKLFDEAKPILEATNHSSVSHTGFDEVEEACREFALLDLPVRPFADHDVFFRGLKNHIRIKYRRGNADYRRKLESYFNAAESSDFVQFPLYAIVQM